MKPRAFLPRLSKKKLAASAGKPIYSTIASPRKAVRKSNPIATKKRKARNAKRMRGAEYKAARAGAMRRAGSQCEYVVVNSGSNEHTSWVSVGRCQETERLQFHELRYPKSRPLTSDDGKIYCGFHHRLVESAKPHKWGKRSFA